MNIPERKKISLNSTLHKFCPSEEADEVKGIGGSSPDT
jgi:hypothetical protein